MPVVPIRVPLAIYPILFLTLYRRLLYIGVYSISATTYIATLQHTMTLLTGEPRTNGYAERYEAAAANLKVNGHTNGHLNGHSKTHAGSQPNSKTLLARFLASCKELESYK